jgi:uncharacterized protein (TIGR02246 family)
MGWTSLYFCIINQPITLKRTPTLNPAKQNVSTRTLTKNSRMTNVLTSPKSGIQLTIEQFTAAWNKHDASAFALLFTEDADFTNVFGQSFHGRAAIEAQQVPIFATMFKNSHISVKEIRVRLIHHSLASVDVSWTMSGAKDFNGNPWRNRRGLMNLIMKKVPGTWLILVMHNRDLPPISLN